MSKRFSSDSLVYSSIDDIPKSGSCFGTISKSIKIGDVTIPAYSRFSFMNTGNSSDGALFAIDLNGYSYTAYRTSGVWNKCFATATKSDLTGIDVALSIREENGGVIASFSSKDSKYGIYIGVGPNGVNANYKLNGEWKKAIIIATKS